jgi:hypothetical protein
MTAPYVSLPPGSGKYLNIAGATTGTLVKSGVGSLTTLTINEAASGSIISLYDGLNDDGVPIATIDGDVQVSLDYGLQFNVGLFVVVTNAPNTTVVYS